MAGFQPSTNGRIWVSTEVHAGEPYHARGAGIADQLAFEFRQPVALYANDGSNPSTDTWELPALGPQTRVVIWIFTATRLLGGA